MWRRMPSDLPHVTDVLAGAGLIETRWFTDYARDRGTALHKATELLDRGILDRASIDPAIAGRFAGYERFRTEVKPEIKEIEQTFFDVTGRYQGRPDRRVVINGRDGILDIKPPSRAPWHSIQLAAYARGRAVSWRWSLHLAEESYVLVEHPVVDLWRDHNIFLSAFYIYHYRVAHGLYEPRKRDDDDDENVPL